ncbi:MAG: heme-binding protein [Pseudomonadota bacterium]
MRISFIATCLAVLMAVPVSAQYTVYTEGQTSETPGFEVVAAGQTAMGPVEVRRYAPYIAAEIEVEAETNRLAASRGFGPLARYIFGANEPGSRISMTEPVVTAPAAGGTRISMTEPVVTAPTSNEGAYTVQFPMPSPWSLDTLPVPEDARVSLIEIDARTLATQRWLGARTDAAVERATALLMAWIDAAGLRAVGPVAVAQFDSPSVARDRQRWEVQVEVANR